MDELVDNDGTPRPAAAALLGLIESLGTATLVERQHVAELDILTMGITFTVYSDGQNIDRAWPFDIIPRVIPGAEWDRTSAGLAQRLRALNMFIDDLYNDQRVIADGVFPADLLDGSANFRAAVPRRPPQARRVGAHLGHRPRPRRRRRAVRPRGQPARAVRRELRAREPRRRQAGLRRAVRPAADPPRRRLHRRAQAPADLARSRRRRRPHARRAHAGHLQLGLLRALVPRPADGRRAGGGRRPRRRRRRLRLHAHDRRPRTGARDLPPHRRPVPRPRGVPPRLDARRAAA